MHAELNDMTVECHLLSTGVEASDNSAEGSSEESGSEGDEDERPRKKKLTLDERRAERAAGDHPLQQRFKELSGRLLEKHTGEATEMASSGASSRKHWVRGYV